MAREEKMGTSVVWVLHHRNRLAGRDQRLVRVTSTDKKKLGQRDAVKTRTRGKSFSNCLKGSKNERKGGRGGARPGEVVI